MPIAEIAVGWVAKKALEYGLDSIKTFFELPPIFEAFQKACKKLAAETIYLGRSFNLQASMFEHK